MNGKLAKRLRRAAETASVGAADRTYEVAHRGRPMFHLGTFLGHRPDSLRLTANCTRGVYRIIKRLRARRLEWSKI
jgi:hypothetical protein